VFADIFLTLSWLNHSLMYPAIVFFAPLKAVTNSKIANIRLAQTLTLKLELQFSRELDDSFQFTDPKSILTLDLPSIY
jgi:hypothetical protein